MGWKGFLLWAVITGTVTLTAWLLLSWEAAATCLLGAVLSWIPIMAHSIEARKRARESRSEMVNAYNNLQRLSMNVLSGIHVAPQETDCAELLSDYGKLDKSALAMMVDHASMTWYAKRVLERTPKKSISMLLMYILMSRNSGKIASLARSSLTEMMADSVFKRGRSEIQEDVELFYRLVPEIDSPHRITSEAQFLSALTKKTPSEVEATLTRQLTDPGLAHLIYGLDKEASIRKIVSKRMDYRRFKDKMAETGEIRRPSRHFLILKQEKVAGERQFRKSIEEFDYRITTRYGVVYERGKNATRGPHSVSVVRAESKYKSALDFAKHTFLSEGIPDTELRTASFVAVPLDVDSAYYFPDDVTRLNIGNKKYMETWMGFLDYRKKRYLELLENNVRFVDLVNLLSLDMLTNQSTPAEEQYLESITSQVKKSLKIKRLLDIGRHAPSEVAATMLSLRYPDFRHSDYFPFLETYDANWVLSDFLTIRIRILADDICKNAKILDSV